MIYMVSDLQQITGLNISVNGTGKLLTDGKGGATSSSKARDSVNGLIGASNDIMVTNDNTKNTQGGRKRVRKY
jgi:hypothetical protein